MNYVKSCLIITMLLGVGYSQCNESNWQEYYPDMEGCNLVNADLVWANLTMAHISGANLEGANLTNTNCYGTFFVGANLEGTNFDGTDLTYVYFDETGYCTGEVSISCDGYDDASYDAGFSAGADYADGYDAGYDDGVESVDVGDMNDDGTNNVLDVVLLVNDILNP